MDHQQDDEGRHQLRIRGDELLRDQVQMEEEEDRQRRVDHAVPRLEPFVRDGDEIEDEIGGGRCEEPTMPAFQPANLAR